MFDIERAKQKTAELSKLIGPIVVKRCGDGVAGEVYYKELTVGQNRKLDVLRRTKRDTYNYRELIIRALDADGEPIWDESELQDILDGGIDPMDAAYIVGSMYTGDKYSRPAIDSGRFHKPSARAAFEDLKGLYGPVMIPGIDEGADLPIYYEHTNGFVDCSLDAIRRKHPDDSEIRVLIDRARDVNGDRVFKQEEVYRDFLSSAISRDEMTTIMTSMRHPRFMSDEERIRMAVAVEANPALDLDDLKN